jgi:hypothetical protein
MSEILSWFFVQMAAVYRITRFRDEKKSDQDIVRDQTLFRLL